MSVERAKPFVAWMHPTTISERAGWMASKQNDTDVVPVVVTPLLPDDPRPGETWVNEEGVRVEVLGSVTVDNEGCAWVECSHGIEPVNGLRRPPVMKTFRIGSHVCIDGSAYSGPIVRAESREVALAKFAESLEEVK